ncbi:class I SAM-dependent methyltransferase [Amycolatopsis sacchari]|uniref:class I SAM-dependent methyltransferase n=1 Tax=Amycolatopsis sacchari TaxID=115433 RepID=UPI003D72E9D7
MADTQYDELGHLYDEHSATNATNAYYDRPAILELAGEVGGKRVLDVGCVGGHLARQLVERGAKVTGIDLSATMIDFARKRCPEAEFHQADLARPLDFLPSDAFDLVTASLVLHYLEDWGPPLAELRRVLEPGGVLVLSVHHPEDWHWFDRPDYFRTEPVDDVFTVAGRPMPVRFYRRPLSASFRALRQAGFAVDQLVEPMPLPGAKQTDPDFYPLLTTAPRFLYFRAISEEVPSGT